jgi:hypothetical protein
MQLRDPNTLESDAYIRLPKPGRRFLGLCRTTIQDLADDGFIEVISVQRKGCSRGVKLLYLPSLMNYLDGLRKDPRGEN